jgi:hypothetical protein
MKHLTFIVLCAVAALTSLAVRASSVEELGWLAGDWVGRTDETFIQEQWSRPEGDSMIGMFRLVAAEDRRTEFRFERR